MTCIGGLLNTVTGSVILTADEVKEVEGHIDKLNAENAKLRELVIDFDKCLDTAMYLAGVNGFATMPDQELFDSLRPRMQELGVVL